MSNSNSNLEFFKTLSIPEAQIKNYAKNDKLCSFLSDASKQYLSEPVDYTKGSFIINSVSKLPDSISLYRDLLFSLIASDQITTMPQVDEFIKFLKSQEYPEHFHDKNHAEYNEEVLQLIKKASGVGVSFSHEKIDALVLEAFQVNNTEISNLRYAFNWGKMMLQIKETDPSYKFIDGKILKTKIDDQKLKVLGERSEIDDKIDKELKEAKKSKGKKDKEESKKDTEKKQKDNSILKDLETNEKLSSCIGREIKSANNTEAVRKAHYEKWGKVVWTRFPPEPNGYLHIGHAKAMRFSFNMARESGGQCYLRYDDTNPYAESQEYIDTILSNVQWLGYTPYEITYSSNYFNQLYEYAEQLINQGVAFVDHTEHEVMKAERNDKVESKWRNRSVEENLTAFRQMKAGEFEEGAAVLRLKIDMQHNNTTLRDPVAYRVMKTHHPRTGNTWCIYPTYDYTHCICDSIEGITHSLCTLEFEIRRDLYYWVLDQLQIWKPSVWEYSRLNVSYAFLSKRKILKCVTENIVSGWNDPRLYTLNGLRRRGYSPDVINAFVDLLGVARKGNDCIVDIKQLEHVCREVLDLKCDRTMAAFEPLNIKINNLPEHLLQHYLEVPNSVKSPERGNRKVLVSDQLVISSRDWRDEDSKDYFGFSHNKLVGLKYIGVVKVVKKEGDTIECDFVNDGKGKESKPKGWITWVAKEEALPAKINIYSHLINDPTPNKLGDDWMNFINKDSITVVDALVHKSLADLAPETQIQLEREGYFVTDQFNHNKDKIELNLVVRLTEKTNF